MSWPYVANLQWSNENWCIQNGRLLANHTNGSYLTFFQGLPGEIYISDAPNAIGYLGESTGGPDNMEAIIKGVNLNSKATLRFDFSCFSGWFGQEQVLAALPTEKLQLFGDFRIWWVNQAIYPKNGLPTKVANWWNHP